MITGNEPINSVAISGLIYQDGSHEDPYVKIGLTIRQHFAAMAMQGILANEGLPDGWEEKEDLMPRLQSMAIGSLACADALINELNKEK